MIGESVKKKLDGKFGSSRRMKKNVIKEDDDEFEEILGTGDGDEETLSLDAEVELTTDEPIDLEIAEGELDVIVDKLFDRIAEDDDMMNKLVNKIAGTDEPLDAINDELDTDVDPDLVDTDETEDEEEMDIEGMFDEGCKKDDKLVEESLLASIGEVILEGYEKDDTVKSKAVSKASDKVSINVFKYKVSMVNPIEEKEGVIGNLSLVSEGYMSEDDEVKKFEVDIDEEGETISISSSSKLDAKDFVEKNTMLRVAKVAKDAGVEDIDVEYEDDFAFDVDSMINNSHMSNY